MTSKKEILYKYATLGKLSSEGKMFSLEEMLLDMSRFGAPTLSNYGKTLSETLTDKWYCILDVHIESKGVEFKVKSDEHETPSDAVFHTLCKLYEAFQNLSGENDE